METYYAQALRNMIARGEEPARAVALVRAHLARQGREQLLPKVARAFARIAQKERAAKGIVLSVARRSDIPQAEQAARDALRTAGVKMEEYAAHIDEGLIGGWRVESGGILLDASWKKHLFSLYSKILGTA